MITSFKVYSDDADEKRVLCADNLDKVLEILENNGYIVEVKRHGNLVNEKRNLTKKYVSDLYWEYDRMSSSGQETLDKLATLYGIETDAQLEERLSKMSKEEMKQELENS